MSRCKGCGADITFIETPAGKFEVGDRYATYSRGSGGIVILPSGEVKKAEDLGAPRKCYRPHWELCPSADKLRKKREAEL